MEELIASERVVFGGVKCRHHPIGFHTLMGNTFAHVHVFWSMSSLSLYLCLVLSCYVPYLGLLGCARELRGDALLCSLLALLQKRNSPVQGTDEGSVKALQCGTLLLSSHKVHLTGQNNYRHRELCNYICLVAVHLPHISLAIPVSPLLTTMFVSGVLWGPNLCTACSSGDGVAPLLQPCNSQHTHGLRPLSEPTPLHCSLQADSGACTSS